MRLLFEKDFSTKNVLKRSFSKKALKKFVEKVFKGHLECSGVQHAATAAGAPAAPLRVCSHDVSSPRALLVHA